VSRRHLIALLALAGTAALVTACTSGGSSPATSTAPLASSSALASSGSLSPSTSGSPSSSAPVVVQRSLLSGRVGMKDGRVLVVKLDNTPYAEPHAGIEDADVVYIEQVEGGLTRMAAVFSTEIPKKIGPIRSARIADIDLFAQYGKVAFAYSGAQHRLRPVIAAANLFNVSGDVGPAGYFRDPSRPAPYNFFGVGPELLARAPHAAHAKDVGFRFSTTPPPGGLKVSSATVRWPAAKAVFVWNPATQRWLLTMDGIKAISDGKRMGGTTVVVQYVRMYDSGYGDRHGGITPMSVTIGSGSALVLRNGKAYAARWSRASKTSGTIWTTSTGARLPFAPGQVWVLLVNRTTHATLTR